MKYNAAIGKSRPITPSTFSSARHDLPQRGRDRERRRRDVHVCELEVEVALDHAAVDVARALALLVEGRERLEEQREQVEDRDDEQDRHVRAREALCLLAQRVALDARDEREGVEPLGERDAKTTVEYQQTAAKPMMPFVTICRARIRRYGT